MVSPQSTILNKLHLDIVYATAMADAIRRPAVGCLADFRTFIMRGNVLDLAVAVIIGAAFNNVVSTLVSGIITPAILNPMLKAANISDISQLSYNGVMYGSFLAAVISFLIISLVLFVIVKLFEKSRRNILKLILDNQPSDVSLESIDSKKPPEDQNGSAELLIAIKDLTKAINDLSKKEAIICPEPVRPFVGRVSASLSDDLIGSTASNLLSTSGKGNRGASAQEIGQKSKLTGTLDVQNTSNQDKTE
jgi:large conductance mechanosensitive channel